MLTRRLSPVNPRWLLLSLNACAPGVQTAGTRPPTAHSLAPTREIMRQGLGADNGIADAIARGIVHPRETQHLDERYRMPQPPATDLLSGLGPDLTGLTLDMDLGQDLADYVDENIPRTRWASYGVMSLTLDEIFGDDGETGLCQPGAALDTFDEDGTTWEASYNLSIYVYFIDGPSPVMADIDDGCIDALAGAGGDVDAAVGADCDETYEHTFFPEGSSCRSCLEEGGGDYLACEDSGDCASEAPYVSWISQGSGEKMWFNMLEGEVFACAPDLPAPMYVFANLEPDGSLPPVFDHEDWAFFCYGYWSNRSGGPTYTCSEGTGGWQLGHTLGEGAVDRVNYIRPEGSSELGHYDRLWYAHSLSIQDGPTIQYFWATAPGAAQISMPTGDFRSGDVDVALDTDPVDWTYYSAWNLNPYALRPDGTDPDVLDDTYARDWLATLTLKTATTIDGILIQTYNHNRCADEDWEGPFADGSYSCATPGPRTLAWREDVNVGYNVNLTSPTDPDQGFEQVVSYPMATLGSTGLPDPDVPGGATVQLAGTASLADEDWDSSSWPTTFVPDHVAFESLPSQRDHGRWLWGDTWRFGAHPELDLRVVLNTNQLRGFRPEEEGYAEEQLGQ